MSCSNCLRFSKMSKASERVPQDSFCRRRSRRLSAGHPPEEQASRDPLRGNLYENFIIADILKGALNRGIRPEVYFFRDSHGNEVDLLIKDKGELTPVEIKSAGTFSADFLKGLERFKALAIKRSTAGAVLYNGEQRFTVRDIRIFNPLQVEDIWDTLNRPPGET